MRTLKYKTIEYSEINFSELGQEIRFDADYWAPHFLRNEDLIASKSHAQIKKLVPSPQYGISISMNEERKGFLILKMDNIMELLAEDHDAKYADISQKTFELFELKKFDVLFNRVNSDEFVGRTGIYLLDGKHTFASYLVRVDSGKPHTNCFISVYLNSKYGKTSLQRVKRRAVNQANINAKELSNLNLPLSSDNLQKKLQNLLEEAHFLKNKSEQLYKESEKILFNELGIDKWQPKTKLFKQEGVKLEVEDTINSEISLSGMLFNNRLDAEFCQPKFLTAENVLKNNGNFKFLIQLATIRKGNQARSTDLISTGIPYASIKDCDNLEITTTELTDAKNPVTVSPGEIAFAITGATIGKAAINNTTNPIAISGDLSGILTSVIPKNYLLVVLASSLVQELARRFTTGATNGHLAIRDIARFPIPLIDKAKMKIIHEKMMASFSKRAISKSLIETAIKATEVLVEQDEKAALNFIKSKVQ